MEIFKHLFADKLVEDDREPVWIFEIPGMEGTYWGFYPPKMLLWQQLLLVREGSACYA
jgi:hypothetical protein